MPIEMTCTCGRTLNLRDELAGKTIRCPACADALQVPIPVEEVVEDIVAGPPPLPPALPQRKVDEIAVAPPVVTPGRPKEPKPKKKKKSVYSEYYGKDGRDDQKVVMEEGWFGSANGGIIGGGITLLVGIIILVLVFSFGGFRSIRLAVFGGIVVVVGVIAILKGLLELY